MLTKLENEQKRFKSDASDDHLYDFLVTANHLEDYLKKTAWIYVTRLNTTR